MSIQQYTTSAPMTQWAGGPWVRYEDHQAAMEKLSKAEAERDEARQIIASSLCADCNPDCQAYDERYR